MNSVTMIVSCSMLCITIVPITVFMVTKFAVAGFYSGKNYAQRRNF